MRKYMVITRLQAQGIGKTLQRSETSYT